MKLNKSTFFIFRVLVHIKSPQFNKKCMSKIYKYKEKLKSSTFLVLEVITFI